MQALDELDEKLDEEIETIHLYVVREKDKRPYTAFPLFCAFLCLLGIAAVTLYSAQHPDYEHKRITVPAIFLPLKVFRAEAPIIPTGVKTYPATYAHGFLTFSNGSVIGQSVPAGFNFTTNRGVEVVTDNSVYVPPGSANGYGYATTAAHLLVAGINMSTLSINEVIGSSLFIRNLSPFTGGHPAYSVTFATAQDRQAALTAVRSRLEVFVKKSFHYPCSESYLQKPFVNIVTWHCQFAIYKVPSYMRVLGATLAGRNFLVTVEFIPYPQYIWVK